jgi:hypothetical protein
MNTSMCMWLTLLPIVLMAPATLAADSNLPAVDPAKLVAFMEKWRTVSTYEYPEKPADWPLPLAALAKDPGGPWARCIDTLAGDARFQIRQVDWGGVQIVGGSSPVHAPAGRADPEAIAHGRHRHHKPVHAVCLRAGPLPGD